MSSERRERTVTVGDGMGVATVTAARILQGQLRGEPGEENTLSFERLPHLALSKTYNTDAQVPDSAGTMTALGASIVVPDAVQQAAASARLLDILPEGLRSR